MEKKKKKPTKGHFSRQLLLATDRHSISRSNTQVIIAYIGTHHSYLFSSNHQVQIRYDLQSETIKRMMIASHAES